jgi:hypothetical protein
MEKKVIFIIVCMLVFSNVVATATVINDSAQSLSKVNSIGEATHTPIAEYGTSTWCGYCKYAHGALKELYAEGELDFYYVTLVCDKNANAYSRAKDDFNLYGYPTVWWDGGYRVNVGAGSIPGAKSYYKTSINYCGNRGVKDVDVELSVTWLGGTEMEINVLVNNNEVSTYNGTIRVYITEIESSKGWKDTAGKLYTFPFLDWAFNENITILSGESWSDSTIWDGSSNGFSSVTEDNTMVIATVFNDEWHQAYSYPPNNNPFNAYYADETVGVRVGNNRLPDTPLIDGATSGEIEIPYNYTFNSVDPDWFDEVYYYIDWGDGQIEEWIGPYNSGEEITLSHIWDTKDTYTLKAKAKDVNGEESDWGTLEVTVPKNKLFIFNFPLLNWLFENFQNLFPALRYIFE